MKRQERQPYRYERSPRREIFTQELDDHAYKIKELLKADLHILQEENAILKAKCKKVTEIESKMDMVLRQNSQLLSENQKISKLLHDKKAEFQVTKNKYESTISQRLNFTSEFEFQRKKLVCEIENLHRQIQEVDHAKNYQINEIRSQSQLQIQNLKKQNATTQQMLEHENRKLREHLQAKDYQLSQTSTKFKRFGAQSQYELIRMNEEKQKLKNEIRYLENEHKKDLEALSLKFQTSHASSIESMKKNYVLNMNIVETENEKLKDYLNNRGYEVEELNNKIQKQKLYYEDALDLMRKENQNLKIKIVEAEKLNQNQHEKFKDKMKQMHQGELDDLKINYQRYIDCLQAEIQKQEGFLKNKNDEIQQLIKQKSSVRQIFCSEETRFKEEAEAFLQKIKQLQNLLEIKQKTHQQKILEKDNHIEYLDKINATHLANSEKQMASLRLIIDTQKNQIEKERISHKQREQSLKQSLNDNKMQLSNFKDQLRRERSQRQREQIDLRNQFQNTIAEQENKVNNLTLKTTNLSRQNQSLKSSIQLKQKQIRALHERVRGADDREKRLEKENDDLRSKIIKKDQKNNEMLADQKKRLESSFAYTLDNLKVDHESAMRLQQNKLSDANQKIRQKEKQIDQLLKSYKKMREQIEVLTEQEANKKDLTIKYPGATADLLATKNLFDVYLKTKVIEICTEDKQKQNRS